MKPFPEASLGKGEQEAQRLAQGHAERRWQRENCPSSPEPRSREQQVELPGPLAPPDEGRMSGPRGGSEGASAGSEQSMEHIQEVPGAERQELAVHAGDSDRTEEDAESPEDPLLSFPTELSVLERLGLHRAALTEQDVEAAFAHLALAFSCDMFTLRQRVEVEKRARDVAEENIQEELGQCRAALEEARMSRAAEVMVQHVENLKRHHVREHAELEDMKRLIQQNSRNRQLAETQDDAEPRLRPHPLLRNFQQVSARRRVSIAVVPKQLLAGTGLDGCAEPALPQPSTPRSEPELRPRSTVTGEPRESEEPEQPELTSKVSPKELWWPWLFLPQHYGILIWLLLLGLVFLFLIPVLELQKLQPTASPKA
ncbi:inositol 1,4,5-triphosphate receptor associated 2-like isoform X3 [Dromaius novaehollandiae]|uniref:inositol 1,4,5-triphosphate receptor associated 2-like isoform X3 n=1 Tax=Dromaius novaehollandiae TaxID=8790 RepID=UPI00311FF2E8